MKLLRRFIRITAIAVLSITTLSCIDNAYDLSNLNNEAQLFKHSLSAPVGTATIYLDSVIGGMDIDTSILSFKNGLYVFGYSGKFAGNGITKTLDDFSLNTPTGFNKPVNLIDASNAPQVPYRLPVMDEPYSSAIEFTLPSFNTTQIHVDSIQLDNTIIKMSVNTTGLSGQDLSKCLTITFTADGKGADYYIGGIKKESWTIGAGEFVLIEIRKLRLSGGNNTLKLLPSVKIKVTTNDDVWVNQKIQTKMDLTVSYPNGIDYKTIWAKVNYQLPDNLDISFDGLGKIINENDVLSIYNPILSLKTKGNIGVPVNLGLKMRTSNSKTGKVANLKDTTFHMAPSISPEVTDSSIFTLSRENGTSNLFKINPDLIHLEYNVQTVDTVSSFIAKQSKMDMSYKMEVPLQFGGDLRISIDTTLENPFADKLDMLENQDSLGVAITLNVRNRIPLTMQIELEALDKYGDSLFMVRTSPIKAAKTTAGIATGYEDTPTEIALTHEQINQIKNTEMFRVSFVITAKQGETFVAVQKGDYITIKIGGKINGGVLLDFSSTSK